MTPQQRWKTYYYWLKPAMRRDVPVTQLVSRVYCSPIPAPPSGVAASDGTYTDKVQVTWNEHWCGYLSGV